MTKCWKKEGSEKLYCEEIDVGEGKPRPIASGLQQYVDISEMTGGVVIFANLKP